MHTILRSLRITKTERPNIDVNKLTHNVWKLDYVSGNSGSKLGPDGMYRSKDSEFHELVRFNLCSS